MQQNLNYVYPHIFWVDGSTIPPSSCAPPAPRPPPVPERKRRKQIGRDGMYLCFLVIFLLVLLALTGVGLGMFQILQLQKELAELREVTSNHSYWGERGNSNKTTGKKEMKTAAHLTGKAGQKSLPLEWETTYGHAFTSGIHYKNSGLVINQTGLYFVYSKVFFRDQTCNSKPLDHTVFKRNPAYPKDQVLMEDRKMDYCVNKMWGRSSYLGALFNLTKWDSLYVSVSETNLVNFEESKTFFGLYKL
uniref:Tumor necrosis factor ligand superfamily member 6 n=1 Tax=Sphenodon punctatus TaxID=8508 RepID=A0A8D0GMW0_SPHPU